MTADLMIRPFEEGDALSFYHNVYRDPSLRNSFGLDHAPVYEEALRYVRERIPLYSRPHFHDYAIVCGDAVVGEINAAFIPEDTADIGYVIGAAFRRRGYGSRAAQILLHILRRDGIRVVYAACGNDNCASRALLKSIGMVRVPSDQVPERVRLREESEDLVYHACEMT